MATFKQRQFSEEEKDLFLHFLGLLTGYLNRCKNLHWAASKNNIHVRLDELHGIMSSYQDALAEGYMGILGKMGPLDVRAIGCGIGEPVAFIKDVLEKTSEFYERIPGAAIFKGISSDCESFIQNLNKYKYLFELCV